MVINYANYSSKSYVGNLTKVNVGIFQCEKHISKNSATHQKERDIVVFAGDIIKIQSIVVEQHNANAKNLGEHAQNAVLAERDAAMTTTIKTQTT